MSNAIATRTNAFSNPLPALPFSALRSWLSDQPLELIFTIIAGLSLLTGFAAEKLGAPYTAFVLYALAYARSPDLKESRSPSTSVLSVSSSFSRKRSPMCSSSMTG